MRFRLLATALAVTMAAPALAQSGDWRTVGSYGDGDKASLMMVDAGSLRSVSGGLREITITSYFATQRQFSGGETYDAIRMSHRFNCATGTSQRFRSQAYAGEFSILTSDTVTEFKPNAPGTVLAQVAPAVCSGNFSAFARIAAATPNLEGKQKFGR